MTSIIWYIYNEYLKKERELAEKAKEKVRKKFDRLRNGDDAGTENGQKKGIMMSALGIRAQPF